MILIEDLCFIIICFNTCYTITGFLFFFSFFFENYEIF